MFEAPYTLGDFSSPMNDALHAIQKWHWQRWFEPQKFEALATFAVWDVDQTAILNKGIIDRPWWPDVPTKVKSLIDEAADCGFEALLYQTDHMGGATLNGQPIPMYLEYGSVDPDMIARTKNLSDYAHSRGLEFWLYKGDQSSHFNWTEGWMEIQDASEPPPHGWPNSNGFCPSSQVREAAGQPSSLSFSFSFSALPRSPFPLPSLLVTRASNLWHITRSGGNVGCNTRAASSSRRMWTAAAATTVGSSQQWRAAPRSRSAAKRTTTAMPLARGSGRICAGGSI